jgi:hypothetical protein
MRLLFERRFEVLHLCVRLCDCSSAEQLKLSERYCGAGQSRRDGTCWRRTIRTVPRRVIDYGGPGGDLVGIDHTWLTQPAILLAA